MFTQSVHQSAPERMSFGAINGTGFFLIRKADAVLVCHAIISIVDVVTRSVTGLVCCMSLKRAQQPKNEGINGLPGLDALGSGVSAHGSRTLLQGPYVLFRGYHCLRLWCRCSCHQRLLNVFLCGLQSMKILHIQGLEFCARPLQCVPCLLDVVRSTLLVAQICQQRPN